MNAYSHDKNTLSEKWTLNSPQTGAIEIEFLNDGTFKYSGTHTNEWYSYAQGTYYYQPESNEIFIYATTGGFDWLYKEATDTEPKLYWGELSSGFQLYFKIKEKTNSQASVSELINSYQEDIPSSEDLYNTEPIWKEENGKYILIDNNEKIFIERVYKIAQ